MSQPRVFVSHSHKDNAFTERLVADLRHAGANVCMDQSDLGAGTWLQRTDGTLAGCEWFVLILTREALASPFVRREVDAANRFKNQGQMHDLIFIQVGSVEHRELPPLWGVTNIFDATRDYAGARDRTLRAVGLAPATSATAQFPARLANLGFTLRSDRGGAVIVPPLCHVAAGPFLMGSDPERDPVAAKESWAADERPQHTVTLPAYDIARFPVTVAEYACFLRTGHAAPTDWPTQQGKLDYPVVNVTWHDAVAYATWLSESIDERWRLPTEAEWEKAERGTDGRIYPWGDSFDKARCNTREGGKNGTTPVGTYPTGASPYGVQDMAGNVWEWTGSRYLDYPYTPSGEHEDPKSIANPVLRGGSCSNDASGARAACRNGIRPDDFVDNNGFRMARVAPSS